MNVKRVGRRAKDIGKCNVTNFYVGLIRFPAMSKTSKISGT